MAGADAANEWSRGCDGEQEEQQDAQQHEQQVPQPQRTAVLPLGALQVTRGGELHSLTEVPAQQVKEQRNGGCPGQQEIEWCEEAHGCRCLASNTRRSGVAYGWSVSTTS